MLEAKRTLVKSGPELWAEVSNPEALAGHLSPFGEIRITRTADGSLVEWEGERATGRLELEASGFGTRVLLQAASATPPARHGLLSRILRRPVPKPDLPDEEVVEVLTGVLDHLGTAHHRSFSR